MTEQPIQLTPVKELADQEVSGADYKRVVASFLEGAKNLVAKNDPFYQPKYSMLIANMTFMAKPSIPKQFAKSIERRLISDGIIKKLEDETYEVLNWEPKL